MAPGLDIAAWLMELKLEQYQAAFQDNAIDGEVLAELTDADLQAIAVYLRSQQPAASGSSGPR